MLYTLRKSKKTHLGGAIDCQLSDAQAKTSDETLLINRGMLSNVTFATESGARLVTLSHPAFDPGQHDFKWMSTFYRYNPAICVAPSADFRLGAEPTVHEVLQRLDGGKKQMAHLVAFLHRSLCPLAAARDCSDVTAPCMRCNCNACV